MNFLDYKTELTKLKREYLNFLQLVDDFQKEKILVEVSKIDLRLNFLKTFSIDTFFDKVNLEFYYVESKFNHE